MTQGSPAQHPGGDHQQPSYRGVAQVRQPHRPRFQDTADLPVVEPTRSEVRGVPRGARAVAGSRGMIVRRRWRRLRSGAGWTWTGLSIVIVCWGIWAVSVRGTDLLGPVIGLVLVLLVGGLLFVVAQLIGRWVYERMLQRERRSAWPSHLAVGGFYTLAGLTFLQQTWWVQSSWNGISDSWQWLVDSWAWLTDLWPM